MIEYLNPFILERYVSKEYFCDRKFEIETLQKRVESGVNSTLISIRRLGKSALIFRLFDEFDEKNRACIYVDLYATQNLKDFTEALSIAILNYFPEKKSIGKQFLQLLKSLRPTIKYDSLTGQPEIHFDFIQPKECERTLSTLLTFLENQSIKVLLAIDEFQQVAHYPEKNTEAILRTMIQSMKNVHFIFSGSNKHLMAEIFNNAKRPFFSSTLILGLNKIPEDDYKAFIRQKFAEKKREIDDTSIDFIIDWTRCHTFYTQMICHQLFFLAVKNITIDSARQVCNDILISQETTYIQYRNLLPPLQWEMLKAIGKEEKLYQPQSSAFLQKYRIGAASSAKKALKALVDKEMVYIHDETDTSYYQVYDVFFSRWLERTF